MPSASRENNCLQTRLSRRAIAMATGCPYFDTDSSEFAQARLLEHCYWQLDCIQRVHEMSAGETEEQLCFCKRVTAVIPGTI